MLGSLPCPPHDLFSVSADRTPPFDPFGSRVCNDDRRTDELCLFMLSGVLIRCLSCFCWGVGMLLARFGGAPVHKLVAVHSIYSLSLLGGWMLCCEFKKFDAVKPNGVQVVYATV
jgi:hypothetical protein